MPMNEAQTRADYIDPALRAAGWGQVDGSRIRVEYAITQGRLNGSGRRGAALSADYVLEYRNTPLAVACASVMLWGTHALVLRGIKEAARINQITTVAKLGPLLLFVLLVPEHANEQHLQILSELAERFSDRNCREALAKAESAEAVLEILSH